MRHALLVISLSCFAAGLLAATQNPCPQPNLVVSGMSGDMQAPCAGAIDFTSASFTPPSHDPGIGSGAAAARSGGGTLKITKYFDKSSPALMLACANATPIQRVTLTFPSASETVVVRFESVYVATVNDSVNPTNESVDFQYGKIEVITTSKQPIVGAVRGNAHPASLSIAVVGGDGKSVTPQHLELTVRRGGTTFNSIQLNPQPLPPRTNVQAGMVAPSSKNPTESLSLNFGKIEFKSATASTSFQFTGGTLVNGNLKVLRANFTGGVHPQ